MNRRRFIITATGAVATGLVAPAGFSWGVNRAQGDEITKPASAPVGPGNALNSNANDLPYHIAVCDWMILKRQKLGAFALAKELGADGVEVDMGSLGDRATFENQLAD